MSMGGDMKAAAEAENAKRLDPAHVPIRELVFTEQQRQDVRTRLTYLRNEVKRLEREEQAAARLANMVRETLADEEEIAKRLGLFTVY